MSAKKKAAPELPKLTNEMVERFVELRDRRLYLNRQASAIATEEDQLRDVMLAHLHANKGAPIEKGKRRLSIKLCAGTVAWKQEFVRALGAEEALKIQQSAPPRQQLDVA